MLDILSESLSTNLQEEIVTISPSRIKVYQTCPKQYHYQYVLKLAPIRSKSTHFDKGNYFHELSHVYYRYIQSGVQVGSLTAQNLIKQRISQDLAANLTEDRIQLFTTITKQFMRYITERSPEIDAGIVVLGVEEELKVPVELPSGRIILLHGYIDLRYKVEDSYRIRDHKTDAVNDPERSIFNYGGVGLSNQLLHYALAKYLETGIAYSVEISWINTKDYARITPAPNKAFALYREPHSEVTIQNYMNTTLQLIDEMLDSKPIPHYDERVCKYCAFRVPCTGERRGIPSDRLLESNYVVIDRTKSRERTLTGEDSDNDETDPIG